MALLVTFYVGRHLNVDFLPITSHSSFFILISKPRIAEFDAGTSQINGQFDAPTSSVICEFHVASNSVFGEFNAHPSPVIWEFVVAIIPVNG